MIGLIEYAFIGALAVGTSAFILFLAKIGTGQKIAVETLPQKKTLTAKREKEELPPETKEEIKSLKHQLEQVQDQLVAQKLAPEAKH